MSGVSRFSHTFLQDRILIVEDEALIREAVALALVQEGYEALVAEGGYTALDLIGNHDANGGTRGQPPINLVVLDLVLPDLSGLELCRLLRQQGNRVPILIISARGSEADIVEGLEAGADDYLTKPFGMREFMTRCRVLLRRCVAPSVQRQPPFLQFRDLVLYPNEHRVVLRGIDVSLSPKEFALLKLLMHSPRCVLSREELLRQIWGADFTGDAKTVDVHVRWLREKLEDDPGHPQYVVTIRGFGYRLG